MKETVVGERVKRECNVVCVCVCVCMCACVCEREIERERKEEIDERFGYDGQYYKRH